MRSKCFSNQQPAVSGQSERTWRDFGTLLTDKGRTIGRARFSFSASASSLRFDFSSLKSSGNRIDALTDHQQQFPRLLTQCFDRTSRQQTWGVASLRSALVLSSQYSAASVSKELDRPLHWLLVVGCWLLKHFGRRPPYAPPPYAATLRRNPSPQDRNQPSVRSDALPFRFASIASFSISEMPRFVHSSI